MTMKPLYVVNFVTEGETKPIIFVVESTSEPTKYQWQEWLRRMDVKVKAGTFEVAGPFEPHTIADIDRIPATPPTNGQT